MDIAEFNKELGYRVAKATGFENNNKINEAIDEWVEISEMVIKASKTPNLEFSYRSMLIEKTKQIIEHIKSLKLKLARERKMEILEEFSDTQEEVEVSNSSVENGIDSTEFEIASSPKEEVEDKKDPKVIKESNFKNLPKGFKEIKTSDDFEIITPHNKDYVKKILSEDKTDVRKSKYPREGNKSRDTKSNKFIDQSKGNCFACGEKVKPGIKICPHCGTILKN
ncbi:MAG: zinc ribbon domain-containing protein [Promethearchaeota archaeon]